MRGRLRLNPCLRLVGCAAADAASPTAQDGEGEAAASAQPVAFGPDTATVRLHDALADGKAQAGPPDLPVPFLALKSGEFAKEVWHSLDIQPHAVVGDRECHVFPFPLRRDPDD